MMTNDKVGALPQCKLGKGSFYVIAVCGKRIILLNYCRRLSINYD